MNNVTANNDDLELQEAIASTQQQLQAGRLKEAADNAQQILEKAPQNIDALYLLSVSQRYLKQHTQALKTLAKLIEEHPTYGRAYQEKGHNLKYINANQEALEASGLAVKYNPALQASWRELIRLFQLSNNDSGVKLAESEFKRLAELPKELVSVSSLIYEKKLFQAEQVCREFLKNNKKHVEGMRLLAELGVKQFVYDDAEFLLENCVKFEPDYWPARHDYVNILNKRQKYQQALEQASYLCNKFPDNVAFEVSLASQNVALGNHEAALESYGKIINKNPQLEMPRLMSGHALKTIGRVTEGIAAYQGAYQARPDFGDAYWSLANLKTYHFSDDEINQMEIQLHSKSTDLVDKYHFCFALGKAFEDRGDFERSFHFYEHGNQLKKSQLRYKSEFTDTAMQRQKEFCDQDFFSKRQGYGIKDETPIFIVGLPRAGSTLLEQILSSHSYVDGTMELPNVIALAHKLSGRRNQNEESRYPQILSDLSNENFQQYASEFIRDTQCYRKGAPYFIDKMPNNFRHIGLIHCMFPNAKIIDARRHPMACCFSGFKQLFADGQEFTFSLEDIANYYKGYVDLMNHWDTVLPGKILRVHYEHVVDDLENQVRRILEYCGLPFEEACLNFHKTERSIRTPSSEQVRQPIYKGGLDQWRNFEPYLGVLKDHLGDIANHYPMPNK